MNASTASQSEHATLDVIESGDHTFLVLAEDRTMADYVIDTTADRFAEKLLSRSRTVRGRGACMAPRPLRMSGVMATTA